MEWKNVPTLLRIYIKSINLFGEGLSRRTALFFALEKGMGAGYYKDYNISLFVQSINLFGEGLSRRTALFCPEEGDGGGLLQRL